jgi:hypothetical protein
MGAYMIRDINRVGDGVPVLPTMAAKPTAPEAPGNPKLAGPARGDATPGRGRKATPGPSDSPKPAQAPATRLARWLLGKKGRLAAALDITRELDRQDLCVDLAPYDWAMR